MSTLFYFSNNCSESHLNENVAANKNCPNKKMLRQLYFILVETLFFFPERLPHFHMTRPSQVLMEVVMGLMVALHTLTLHCTLHIGVIIAFIFCTYFPYYRSIWWSTFLITASYPIVWHPHQVQWNNKKRKMFFISKETYFTFLKKPL